METVLGKGLPSSEAYGESWEIYDFPPGVVTTAGRDAGTDGGWVSSVVAGKGEWAGKTLHQLVVEHGPTLLGEDAALDTPQGPQFPLLVKFLDAREDLSIQVHPTPAYAAKHPGAHLKTECWIVLDHTKGASIYKHLRPGVTREAFAAGLKDGSVAGLIQQIAVREGDCHFLPSGTVHALGAGILVAEVQTPSDTTFRVWDFGRLENGKPRKLHVEEALACIDFETPPPAGGGGVTSTRRPEVPLVDCEYFRTTTIRAAAHAVRPMVSGKMKVWVVAEGGVKLRWGSGQLGVRRGQTVLLPAVLPTGTLASFATNAVILETTVRKKG